jgi:hypothetical protein
MSIYGNSPALLKENKKLPDKRNRYWKWYRIVYLLLTGGTALFFGTRISQTIRYWDLLENWQAYPGRWYMLTSGMILSLIAAGSTILFVFFHKELAKWICSLNAGIAIWVWIEQLFLSQIPDRFGKIPFLLAGTLILAGWTYLVFRQEFVHDQVC